MAKSSKIKIGIVGLGMVGGPIKKWFEDFKGYKRGSDLFCYDADPKKGYTDDINKADLVFVSVPTPPNKDGSCNTSIVESAVGRINDGKIIVVKSTITPGTVEKLQKQYPRKSFMFNPEFLTESQAWRDFLSPDRQIIGHTIESITHSPRVLNLLPKKRSGNSASKDFVNSTEAEFGKYASNVFGYIKVIYGNILADFCHATAKVKGIKVDYENIKDIISADMRIGPSWLNISHGNYSGAGGFCFPKDMNAFIAFGETLEKDAIKKKLLNKDHLKILQSGLAVLKAVRDYNKTLIESQGLSMEDVSKHDKEIIVEKRKRIRAVV